ncbi:MAG: amidohydrolase family protein, partial [Chloroflexales bacterium]|nr:amidohydrolase family protein [Chloroflexales bacterium]
DIALLRAHGVGAVPCPTSNLKLASGIAPYRQLLDAGVKTGLGTDGPASNDDQDMFAEIHLAALLPKGVSGDPTAVPARDALSLATNRGAQAIHMAHLIGSLEAGMRADVIVVELGRLHSAPRYTYAADSIYSHLVYSARATDVRDVLVDGRLLVRDRELLTLDESAILARAQQIADRINTFLAGREQNLLDKLLALGDVDQDEIFEVQVKAHVSAEQAERIAARLLNEPITITKASERTQYDTYFLFERRELGRVRLREDRRTDAGARLEPKYTITLMEQATRGDYPFAILLSRARYTAIASHTTRFYREYLQPDHVIEIGKQRRRWRILYKGEDFALNLDTLPRSGDPGPFLEIKSRTWGRRDADEKAALIGELLALFEVDDEALVKQEYVEMER